MLSGVYWIALPPLPTVIKSSSSSSSSATFFTFFTLAAVGATSGWTEVWYSRSNASGSYPYHSIQIAWNISGPQRTS